VGGISRGSLNKKFFHSLEILSPEGFDFETFDISRLPFYSQDLENDPPDIVSEFKEKIREAEAVLFITPEYNRSFPGVLKNAIDWGSRPYGMNLWQKKPVAVTGASPGNIGTFGAQHHLRQVFAYLDMLVMGQPEFYFNAHNGFNDKGELANASTKTFAEKFFKTFREFIEKELGHTSANHFRSNGLEDSPMAH
jgi:chromate reductase